MIDLVAVAELAVSVGTPIEVGETPAGIRRVVPILGGEVSGRIRGRVLPFGADYQLLRPESASLHARYVIETDKGTRIYVENSGLRRASPDVLARLNRGEQVDPASIYFRSVPRFETSDPSYIWLTEYVFVADGKRRPDRVELTIYQVT